MAARAETTAVRVADPSDIRRIASTLACAFDDDPFWQWLIPAGPERFRRLRRWFALYTRHMCIAHGACYVTPAGEGAALWIPPGVSHLSRYKRLALVPLKVAAMGPHLGRLMGAFDNVETYKPAREHFYLSLIGVRPDSQSRGVGAALMQPVLGHCDSHRTLAYLEATTERSRDFYTSLGFEVQQEFANPPGGGPTAWGMLRLPRQPA